MPPAGDRLVAAVAVAVAVTGCGAVEYRLQFENDLPQAVVVEGCVDCGNGREVGARDAVPLKAEQDVTLKVTTKDGTVVGCSYVPDGASTSDALPIKASDFEDSVCDAAPGARR